MNIKKMIEFMKTSCYLLVVIVLTFLFIKYVCQRTDVIGSSMSPTLEDGDCLIVDKISYKFREPERYDIIIFPYRDDSNRFYVKRIIGVPGDTIFIQDGKTYINQEELSEPYLTELIDDAGIAATPITLGEDEYFVMGDNRNNSYDSRTAELGIVSREEITGKICLIMWPFDRIKLIKHEWE